MNEEDKIINMTFNSPVSITINQGVNGKQVYSGHGKPTEPPSNQDVEVIYFDLDTYQMYIWNKEMKSW